jgi:hypothetical protein
VDPWYRGLARFAGTGAASLLAFSWALSEAVWFFLVPEFLLCFLVVPRPRRVVALAAWATAGSVVGGLGAFFLSAATGSHWLLDHSLLVTPRGLDRVRPAPGWIARTAAGFCWADGETAPDGGAHAGLPVVGG